MPGMPPQQRPQAPQSFNAVREKLRGSYQVVPANLAAGHVGDEVDVLVLAGPANLDDKSQRAVDQFLMRSPSASERSSGSSSPEPSSGTPSRRATSICTSASEIGLPRRRSKTSLM